MKKFSFALDSVLTYKNQVLDNLKSEHGKIISLVSKQEQVVSDLIQQYNDINASLNEKNAGGITAIEVATYKDFLRTIDQRIKAAQAKLAELKEIENAKRLEVVEAKKETASIEKLKEKKIEEYKKEVQKNEELLIEEFVSNCRSASE